jgi:DNA-binding NtrC family response regulator
METGEVRRLGESTTGKVSVRVVAATNEDLEQAEGFRRDLYYRLNVLRVDLPALRDRLEDLPALTEHWLERIGRETGRGRRQLSPEALAALIRHRWPGNVRELVNGLRRACSLSGSEILGADDFAFLKAGSATASSGLLSIDEHIRETLLRYGSTIELQEIADRLGLSRKTLWEKKKKWGL